MRTFPLILVVLILAGAQSPDDEDRRARLLGALVHTRVTGRFDETPSREAFKALGRACGLPIHGRYHDDRAGHGIDPEAPITLAFEDVDVLLVLELVLEQCEVYEPCTWQLRRGMVEVGTKQRLSAPAAIERRVYPIRDLLLEAPYFASGARPSVAEFHRHPYASAALTRPAQGGRKSPDELALEIMEGIVEVVEPGNWDYGQFDDDDASGQTAGAAPHGRSDAQRSKIASLRRFEDKIVIRAPDFIHRQVGGYPEPIPPAPLTDDEIAERLVNDDANGIRLVVVRGEGRRPQ